MSSDPNKIAQTSKKFIQRLEELEKFKDNFNVQALGMFIDQTNKRLDKLDGVSEGIVALLGADAVQKSVDEVFTAKVTQLHADNQAIIDKATGEGLLTTADTVVDTSLMLVTEQSDKGVEIGSRVWAYAQVPQQFQSQFLGKKVGDTILTPQGGTLTVAGIYAIDQAKMATLQAAQQAGAQAAAQAAAAATQAPAATADNAPAAPMPDAQAAASTPTATTGA